MQRLIVSGGARLSGQIVPHGSKNAALPILAATLLVDAPVRLPGLPGLLDVENMLLILEDIGCTVVREPDAVTVDARTASACVLPERTSKELRSSIFLLGSVLSRFGRAVAAYPGGCDIGNRPIDLHLASLRRLGAVITEDGGRIVCTGERLSGAVIHLDYPSVGATENSILAACRAEGETIIRNAAREPEIADLQAFLRQAGFRVRGAGTSSVVIEGRPGFGHALEYRVMPDRIVAGTFLIAGAITRGDVFVRTDAGEQLAAVAEKLRECGSTITFDRAGVRVQADSRPLELQRVDTLPCPGFPTDCQAQLFALSSVARGTSVFHENVFENRFRHAQELRRMGGKNSVTGTTAIVRGVEKLHGATVEAHDLRGGAALVLAGLCADGETAVTHAWRIDRGYLALETALCGLGATVIRKGEDIDGQEG